MAESGFEPRQMESPVHPHTHHADFAFKRRVGGMEGGKKGKLILQDNPFPYQDGCYFVYVWALATEPHACKDFDRSCLYTLSHTPCALDMPFHGCSLEVCIHS